MQPKPRPLGSHLAVQWVICMASAGADVATGQLEPTGLLAPTITHKLGKLTGGVDVGDVAVALAAHL